MFVRFAQNVNLPLSEDARRVFVPFSDSSAAILTFEQARLSTLKCSHSPLSLVAALTYFLDTITGHHRTMMNGLVSLVPEARPGRIKIFIRMPARPPRHPQTALSCRF